MEPTFSKSNSEPWYQKGLKFQCTECGKCCTGFPGYVWVTHEEIDRLSNYLKISSLDFRKKYTRLVNGRFALIEQPKKNYDCIFLNGKQCSVYEERPIQCRTFPWWKQNLVSSEAWKQAASECEGIHDQAPIVPYEKIKQLLEENEKKFTSFN